LRSTASTGKKLHTLRGRWSQTVHVTDTRSGATRVLFEAGQLPHAAHSPRPHTDAAAAAAPANVASAAAPAIVTASPCALPRALVDAADAAAPAVAEAAAIMGAVAGAEAPTLASTAVWARLSAAVVAHDWHTARGAKHAVEEAQRVRDASRVTARAPPRPIFRVCTLIC
jgi:hypothetical protein